MRFDIVTIFPDFFESPLKTSIIGKANNKNLVEFHLHNIRDNAHDKHSSVDDTPYGGGAGMVMMAGPLVETIESIPEKKPRRRILLTPRGFPFTQRKANELSKYEQLVIACGRYEGVDQRVVEEVIDEEISLGDYIINGGEAASLVLIEAITRLLPGVLGNQESAETESFSKSLLEHPHYTKPQEFRGKKVPNVLLSGNHAEIEKWRHEQSLATTKERRPDLIKSTSR